MNISELITQTKDVVNIIFFIVIGSLAILSYLQAKRTLFTPLKTEIFKLQLKAIEELLTFFNLDALNDIHSKFDLSKIVQLNSEELVIAYAKAFFGTEIKNFNERLSNFTGFLLTDSYAKENVFPIDTPMHEISDPNPPTIDNPAVILARWQKFEFGIVGFTEKFSTAKNQLKVFLASPILTPEIKNLITEFEQTVNKNVLLTAEILTKAAQEFPNRYPTIQSINEASFDWIWSEYNQEKIDLEELQLSILKHIGNYLKTDKIIRL